MVLALLNNACVGGGIALRKHCNGSHRHRNGYERRAFIRNVIQEFVPGSQISKETLRFELPVLLFPQKAGPIETIIPE